MKHIVNRDAKKIVLDSITREFLGSLRELRIMYGISTKTVAEYLGIDYTALIHYEKGNNLPSIKILMGLSEIYNADLSGSINYKYWHGEINFSVLRREINKYGLTHGMLSRLICCSEHTVNDSVQDSSNGSLKCLSAVIEILTRAKNGEIPRYAVNKGGLQRGGKKTCLDEITVEFLRTLKARRVRMGLSQNVLARMIGVGIKTLRRYESHRCIPTIKNLMILADILGVDLSASINSKYHHGEIRHDKIKSGIRDYGLTYAEIGRMTNYHGATIRQAVLPSFCGSLKCLSDVIDVLDHERELSQIRNEICHAERKKKSGNKSSGRRF